PPLGVAAELRLRHVSVLAGAAPVFRFDGPGPRVWVDDSVVAPAQAQLGDAILVAAIDPAALGWRGRGNLYGRLAVYLQPTGSGGRPGRDAEPVRSFADWAESAALVKEIGSVSSPEPVWSESDPEQALAQETLNPGRAFRLAAAPPGNPDVGARLRQGPFGTVPPPVPVASYSRAR